MARRRHGRVRIDFGVIERAAAEELATMPMRDWRAWQLSRASSLHRRKDGTYTLVLIWKAGTARLTSTIRGLRLEAA